MDSHGNALHQFMSSYLTILLISEESNLTSVKRSRHLSIFLAHFSIAYPILSKTFFWRNKVKTIMKLGLNAALLLSLLSGCAVISVADAVVGTTVSVGSAVVGTTVDVAGAGVRAVTK